MLPRRVSPPFYERSLIAALEEKNSAEAVNIISAIQAYNGVNRPSLTYVDSNRVNFVQFALQCGLPDVALVLLATDAIKDNVEILFSRDSMGRTLVSHAAGCGSAAVVERLCDRSRELVDSLPPEDRAASAGYKIWLAIDSQLNTPLHYAAQNINTKLYTYLIQLISQEQHCNALINQANNNGDTPLHVAFTSQDPNRGHLIYALIEAGADLGRLNGAGLSGFQILWIWSAAEQLAFLQLNKNNQAVLKFYKDAIAAHPEMVLRYYDYAKDKEGQDAAMATYPALYAYFTYLSKQSLMARTIAALELDPRVKPRSTYTVKVRTGFSLHLKYQQCPEDKLIIEDIKQKRDIVYLYLEGDRIKFAARGEENEVKRIDITDDINPEYYLPIKKALTDKTERLTERELEELTKIAEDYGYDLPLVPPYKTESFEIPIVDAPVNLESHLLLYSEKLLVAKGLFAFNNEKLMKNHILLKKDRATLDQLINQIDAAIRTWYAFDPLATKKYKAAAVLIPTLLGATVVAVGSYLIYMAVKINGQEPTTATYLEKPITLPNAAHPNYEHIDCIANLDDAAGGDKHMPGKYGAYRHIIGNSYKFYLGPCAADTDDLFINYAWATVGVLFVGLVFTCAAGTGAYRLLWNKETPIAKASWQDLMRSLQDLSVKLKVQADAGNDTQNIQDLMREIARLDDAKLKAETIEIFTNIADSLETIRDNMLATHKPFSTTAEKDRFVQKIEEKNDDDEIPLMDLDASAHRNANI